VADAHAPVDTVASAKAWRDVWIVIACLITVNAIVACFLKSVKSMMNGHVESALEDGKVREEQIS
jgi:hypothetical protein